MSIPSEAVLQTFADVHPRSVQWLWPRRIPVGKLTLLAGDPGLGKSFLTLDMASRVSTNADWPDGESALRLPGDTLILSAEDDPGDTIRPRLDAQEADTSRVHFIKGMKFANGVDALVRLDRDLQAVGRAIKELERPRLVIIDPISAYMGDTDANSNAEVRRLLSGLASLAESARVAVVAVTHLTKGTQTKTLYRAMGSLAFTAAARCVYAVAKDPHVEGRCVVLPVKSNLDVVKTGLAYTIERGKLQWVDTNVATTIEEVDQPGEPIEAQSLEEAAQWLDGVLSNGPVGADRMRELAARDGVPWITLRRAKKRAGVESVMVGGAGEQRWVWRCAEDRKSAPEEPQGPRNSGR